MLSSAVFHSENSVWVEVTNGGEGFSVSQVKGTFTADISMRVTMDSGASRVIVKKGVKLSRFL
jgi:hypothetical protein